jgi:hypothetical protein
MAADRSTLFGVIDVAGVSITPIQDVNAFRSAERTVQQKGINHYSNLPFHASMASWI